MIRVSLGIAVCSMALEDTPLIAAIREFAARRSHQDSQISNENSRSAGQAAILINGGAATAIVALFSRIASIRTY
jgi:hypothetical protein